MSRVWLVVFFALMVGVLAGQELPTVVVQGNCPTGLPEYKQWLAQTRLANGSPYVVDGKRKQQIVGNYQELKLNMSAKQAEMLLGQPDFAAPHPAARLSTSPPPAKVNCTNQIAYILKKTNENMADMADVAVYLFFSPEDKLYWASPQNIPELKALGSPVK